MESILITGASGFIGSFLTEEAASRGYETWAGVRATSSRRYLQDERIRFLELDFSDPSTLWRQLKEHKQKHGPFDYVIHCAGATKCADKRDFDRINFKQTIHLAETLCSLDMIPRQFIFISTLSVFGPIHETTYEPIRESDMPAPDTAYGHSKLKAELYLESIDHFPYVIFRPTGVYGPRERDYFLMAKSIRRHVDFSVGYRRQDITFVHVRDVVQAVFLAIEKGVTRRAYFLSDGHVYQSRTFSDLIRRELGHPVLLRLRCPLCILKAVSLIAERWAGWRGKSSTLNSDKYRIMKQRNWRCDITPTIEELGYKPMYDLSRGVNETMAWYKKEHWL